jgi:RND family efflux transporter MFP subunit
MERKKMEPQLKPRFRILLLLTILPTLAMAQEPGEAPAAPVFVEQAQQDAFAASLWVSGTVISKNDARIAAETQGRITWVADVGERIEQGQALARIDATDLELDLADSEARLSSLQTRLDYEDSNLARLQSLAAEKMAAANQVDEAQSMLDMTRQEIKRAEVGLAQIKRRIDQTEVLAPFPGVVAQRLVQIGEFVNRGSEVARLVDTDHREIRAQAPLSVAGWIREGLEVTVEHQNDQALSPVSRVIPVGDQRSRMFELRVVAHDPAWIVGSPVRVQLPNSELRELVAIPRDALVLRGNDIYVMRVKEDNTIERVDVQTGIGLGGFVEVIGAVNDGDRLVTRGGERLQAGQTVRITGG